jgi:hypothetical protein
MNIMKNQEKLAEERLQIQDGTIRDLSHLNLLMATILTIKLTLEEQMDLSQNKLKEILQSSTIAAISLKMITGKQE